MSLFLSLFLRWFNSLFRVLVRRPIQGGLAWSSVYLLLCTFAIIGKTITFQSLTLPATSVMSGLLKGAACVHKLFSQPPESYGLSTIKS